MIGIVDASRKDTVTHRAAPSFSQAVRLARASVSNSNWTGRPVFCCTTMAQVRIWPPITKCPILILATSQPRSLLSIAKSNNARSRRRPCWSRKKRMAETPLPADFLSSVPRTSIGRCGIESRNTYDCPPTANGQRRWDGYIVSNPGLAAVDQSWT
jgi:hypothetical protein